MCKGYVSFTITFLSNNNAPSAPCSTSLDFPRTFVVCVRQNVLKNSRKPRHNKISELFND